MLTNIRRQPKRAILFSDLHYSHATQDTCFKVLDFIYEKAIEYGMDRNINEWIYINLYGYTKIYQRINKKC